MEGSKKSRVQNLHWAASDTAYLPVSGVGRERLQWSYRKGNATSQYNIDRSNELLGGEQAERQPRKVPAAVRAQ